MDFWDTFWATMCGALAGAVVGAAAAWVFALELRRRDTHDRERLLADQYADRIRQEWPKVFGDLQDYGNASRAIYDAERTDRKFGDTYDHHKQAFMRFTQRLVEVATIAKNDDYTIVDLLGQLTVAGASHTEHHITALDSATSALMNYTITRHEEMELTKARLVNELGRIVVDARRAEFAREE